MHAYWSIKESHTPFTMHHPMHLPNKCTIHSHAMHLSTTYSLVPRLVFWNKTIQCTFHLHIYAMHTLQGDIYARPLILYYGLAKLQIVYVEKDTTPLPRQHTRMLLISHFCSGVGVIGIPLILSSHHHCPISTE